MITDSHIHRFLYWQGDPGTDRPLEDNKGGLYTVSVFGISRKNDSITGSALKKAGQHFFIMVELACRLDPVTFFSFSPTTPNLSHVSRYEISSMKQKCNQLHMIPASEFIFQQRTSCPSTVKPYIYPGNLEMEREDLIALKSFTKVKEPPPLVGESMPTPLASSRRGSACMALVQHR